MCHGVGTYQDECCQRWDLIRGGRMIMLLTLKKGVKKEDLFTELQREMMVEYCTFWACLDEL